MISSAKKPVILAWMPVSSHTDVKLWFGLSLNHASPLSAQTILFRVFRG